MTPLLSIVTGTYQRIDYLRAMIVSVRRQIPVGMTYEFVIVDGGSTDGTDTWCREQPDITFIQQGELLGAIRAFDAGCDAARGVYVALLNDDVVVVDGTLVKALVHLETHPDCGAVAFADGRAGAGNLYGIQADGTPIGLPYARCGLFRKWLGDLCDWWGSKDMEWGDSHTYGGDNRLSHLIWQYGYTVDELDGCKVEDRIPQDGLRERNHQIEGQIGSAYTRGYSGGVHIGSKSKPTNSQTEQMRILYAPLFSPGYGRYKRGLCDALMKVGVVYELDIFRQREQFAEVVKDFQPHLILLQLHDGHLITAPELAYARSLAPNAVVCNWVGDVYMENLINPSMLELLKHVDLQLVVNADALPIYADYGIHAAYWQIGFEPVPDTLPPMPAHNLLFMGNVYGTGSRIELGKVLRELDPGAGLYGLGWVDPSGSGNTFYQFDKGAALYRNCKIAIGDNQYMDKGFVSNRLFEALSNGAFLLHQTIPGLEELTGLKDGVHYVSWSDYDDLRAKVRYYLNTPERQQIAAAGESFVRAHHSFDQRVKELFEVLLSGIQEVEHVAI